MGSNPIRLAKLSRLVSGEQPVPKADAVAWTGVHGAGTLTRDKEKMMNAEQMINVLLDRLTDAERDAGRLERERDIASVAAEEKVAMLDKFQAQQPRAPLSEVVTLLTAMERGLKINAIRSVRAITGAGLKEAKDTVEAIRPVWGPPNYD